MYKKILQKNDELSGLISKDYTKKVKCMKRQLKTTLHGACISGNVKIPYRLEVDYGLVIVTKMLL
jgi:hypothetical protein